jgi:hypothetical protein
VACRSAGEIAQPAKSTPATRPSRSRKEQSRAIMSVVALAGPHQPRPEQVLVSFARGNPPLKAGPAGAGELHAVAVGRERPHVAGQLLAAGAMHGDEVLKGREHALRPTGHGKR